MSEVKRYMHIEPLVEADARMRQLCSRATIYVKESDHESQLDALREELAVLKVAAANVIAEGDELEQRLADAERRMTHAEQWSATLERAIFRALDDSSEDAETGTIEIMRCDYEALAILIGEPAEAALTKPEEAKS